MIDFRPCALSRVAIFGDFALEISIFFKILIMTMHGFFAIELNSEEIHAAHVF